MNVIRNVVIFLGLILLMTFRPLYAEEYILQPFPEWVVPIDVDEPESIPKEEIIDGLYYLLVDSQIKVEKDAVTDFYHYSWKIINQTALQNDTQISIDFDPSYQKLTLHDVRVRRGQEIIEKLDLGDIPLLQREKDLESQIYDGTKTAHIILSDIHVGDIIEYSYSIKGANPVFNGLYFEYIDIEWDVPINRVYTRLLWPKQRSLYFKNHDFNVEPEIKLCSDHSEYVWDINNVPGSDLEDALPNWYDPYAMIQLSETETWADIVNWGYPLYRIPEDISEDMEAELHEISQSGGDKKAILSKVLRFVQDEIRYMGIEMGPNSHRPTDPAVVLSRRFGDCKDKSLLMVTMLNKLGIKAYPALVNTYLKEKVAERQPSPYAFNHVIVKADLDDRVYWLDPTNTYQRGTLENIYQADFGKALVLSEEIEDLTSMPSHESSSNLKTIKEILDLRAGVEKVAYYTVETTFRGEIADGMRWWLAESNSKDVQKEQINYYASDYPSISSREKLKIEDDQDNNEIKMIESYEIPKLWKYDKEDAKTAASIPDFDESECFSAPDVLLREMPLIVRYPFCKERTIEILLPEPWPRKTKKTHIKNKVFSYEKIVYPSNSGKTLNIDYKLETYQDYVPVSMMREYFEDIEELRETTGHEVYISYADEHSKRKSPDNGNFWIFVYVLIGILGFIAILVICHFVRSCY